MLRQFTLRMKIAETALRLSWLWPSLARFPGKRGIFSGTGDSKLTPHGLGLQWNGHSKTLWTFNFELVGRNIPQLLSRTHRVADTVLRASWYWLTLAWFPGSWVILSSPRDSKLTLDGFASKWNWHTKTFRTPTFELLWRNIALLHFKTERLAETALRTWWFWPTSAQFPRPWGIFSCPRDWKMFPKFREIHPKFVKITICVRWSRLLF